MAEMYNREEELDITDSCLCFLTPQSRVLEFGSASGYMTRYMKTRLSCRVTCIEINPIMAVGAKPYAEKVVIADIENDNWESELNGTFDYILFADVLEHLRDPQRAISRAKSFLAPNGFILTSIPNIGHNAIILNLRKGLFNYTPTGLLDNTHIHLMTRNSIQTYFQSNDLFCNDELSKMMRPCDTEQNTYYIQNPLLALAIIFKPDAHVYRYVQKWSHKNEYLTFPVIKFNLFKAIFELCYDGMCYFKRKMNFKTPVWFAKLFFTPLLRKEAKRYEKFHT